MDAILVLPLTFHTAHVPEPVALGLDLTPAECRITLRAGFETAMDLVRDHNVVVFGPFEANLRVHELRKRGARIKLREKSFDVLAALLECPSELVTREELRKRLWPDDVFVDFENNLNTAVARLRQALGDSADNPKYIETVPRHGYRFIAETSTKKSSGWRTAAGPVRIVVLPFVNLSGDPSQEYFSDGMTEELITELACYAPEHLAVIARTTAMRYRNSRKPVAQIGRELDVDYVIEGSIRRTQDRVRISAQLIKASDETHLWAKSYDGELSDAFRLQSDVSQAIVKQIGISLSEQTRRLRPPHLLCSEAHDAFLLGLHHFNHASPDGFQKADFYFQQVAALGSPFAPACAKQAMAHALSAFFGYADHSTAFPLAESAARSAIQIDPDLTEAHTALALVHWFHDWDMAACEWELRTALKLNTNDPTVHWTLAMFLGSMKEDHERAAVEGKAALSLDPLSTAIRSMLCWLPYWARQYDQAIAQAHAMLELDDSAPQAFYVLGAATRAKGALREAIATLQQAVTKFGDPFSMAYLGMAYGLAGERDAALAILDQLIKTSVSQPVAPMFRAFINAAIGEKNIAIQNIEKALDGRDTLVLWLRVSPDWDILRHETGFQQLLRKLDTILPPRARVSAAG